MQLIQMLRSHEFTERVKRLKDASPQNIEKLPEEKSQPLHIVYAMTHVGVCGGVKVILQHANGLKKLGLNVSIVSHFPKPDWYPIEANYIKVPFGIELTRALPLCDVIVATYWDHIHACIESGIAPVVYFEQGDFHLFKPIENVDLLPVIQHQFQLAPYIITVSNPVKEIIKNRFKRESLVFPNALDSEVFYPKQAKNEKKYMMIVGSDTSKFKGMADLLKAFDLVKEKGHDIELLWLTQTQPQTPAGEVFVNPLQAQIGELYRKATVYVCGSYYEAFPLPPLESMACGTPVVTTRTPGVTEYAKHEQNCLMVEPGDVQGLADSIIRLLTDESLYYALHSAGLETVKQYSWDYILKELAQFYEQIAQSQVVPKYKLNDWSLFLEDKTFDDPDAREILHRFLSQTDADEVFGPVRHQLNQNTSFFIWQPLADRKAPLKEGKIEKILLQAQSDTSPVWPGREIALNFESGDFFGVIKKVKELLSCPNIENEYQGVFIRWVIQCLLELKQYELAQSLITKSLIHHPFYTDLYYLQVKLFQLTHSQKQTSNYIRTIHLLQNAASYPECLNLEEMMMDSKEVNPE